jgi:hypothetical protein
MPLVLPQAGGQAGREREAQVAENPPSYVLRLLSQVFIADHERRDRVSLENRQRKLLPVRGVAQMR